IEGQVARRGEIDIEPAVAVVVEEGDAAAQARGELLLGAVAAAVDERDPGLVRDVAEADRRGRGHRPPHPVPLPGGARATAWPLAGPDPLGAGLTIPFSPPGRRCPKGG